LGKSHANELLAAPKVFDSGMRVVAFNQTVQSLAMNKIQNLSQHKSAGIHGREWALVSNASHPFFDATRSFNESSATTLLS
jgi:hypothetical protein